MSQESDVEELRPRPELHWTTLNYLEQWVTLYDLASALATRFQHVLESLPRRSKCKANSILMPVVGCGVWVFTFWPC